MGRGPWALVAAALGVLLGTALYVARVASPSTAVDMAALSALAVGIERLLEGIWSGIESAGLPDGWPGVPGRRLLSLVLALPLGVLAAGVLGVDLFSVPVADRWHVSVVMTGMILGLLASPAHAIVQGLENLKDRAGS